MTKRERIDTVFNILVQYEHVGQDDTTTEQTYRGYLDRMYVWFVGYGNEKITTAIRGLWELGMSATHSMVKSTVFHIIKILEHENRWEG